jgi:hypothetical protein
MSKKTSVSVSCGGCVTTIIVGLIVWALLFGVTIDGKHYGLIGCDSDKGVHIDKGTPK